MRRNGVMLAALAVACAIFGISAAGQPGAARAAASPVRHTAASPIKHIVVVYMENHSFDNVLGYWCDDNPGRCPVGGMPASVTLSNGKVVTPGTTPDTVPYVKHDVASQVAAINGGKMNGWQKVTGCNSATGFRCISGYQPGHIPNLVALASKFAISDKTFSEADSPSWGGHLDVATGNLDGFTGDDPVNAPGVKPRPGWGCNSDKIAPWIPQGGSAKQTQLVPSCIPDFNLSVPNGGAFEPTPVQFEPTIFDRLEGAKLTWAIYGAPTTKPGDGGYIWDICTSLAQCLDTKQAKNVKNGSDFIPTAKAGRLPSFSIVTPGGSGHEVRSSCHNEVSMTACDNRIGQLVTAVEDGADWSSTVIFVTFDDCGCFYDQVPPPKAPDGTREGPRVPLIIVSPYARPGYTDNSATSFAGILAYTEHNFGLSPLGTDDAKAYDFSDALNYAQAPLKPVRMVTRKLPWSARHIRLTKALMDDPT